MIDHEMLASLGGRIRRVQGHHPMVLDDPNVMWLVGRGSVAVFASQVDKGFPIGPRQFLFKISRGAPLFPVSDGKSATTKRLIVLSMEQSELYEVPLRRVDQVFAAAGIPFLQALENWVDRLSGFIAGNSARSVTEKLPAEGELVLEPEQRVKGNSERVSWLKVAQGALLLIGAPELRLPPVPVYIPIGRELWAAAAENTHLEIGSAPRDNPGLIKGLSLFNAFMQRRLDLLSRAENAEEIERLSRRENLQQRAMDAALAKMGAVLDRRTVPPAHESDLLNAAIIVGENLGVEIRPPARGEETKSSGDPIEPIARASHIRYRRVILSGKWWKSDCGPLLAYLQDEHRPVALIRDEREGYQLVDPISGENTAVTEEIADRLAPHATVFYRPLPLSIRKPWHITRFSLRGRRTDVLFIIGLALLTTLIGMLTPQATALVMDKAIPDANQRLLGELGLALIAAAFGMALFALAQTIVSIRVAIMSDVSTQSAMWDRLLSLRMSFFKQYSSGDLLARVSAISEINQELNGQTLKSLLSSFMSLLNLALLYYYNSKLAMIALGLGAAVALVTILCGVYIRRFYRAIYELQGTFFGFVVQMVNAVGKIRVAGAERRAFVKWADRYHEQLQLLLKAQRMEDYVIVFNQSLPVVSSILLFWFGVKMLGSGAEALTAAGDDGDSAEALTVGVFLAFNTAMGTFISGATSLSGTVVDVLDTVTKSRRMVPLMEADPETDLSKIDPGTLSGEVSLNNIDFKYSSVGKKILDNINIKINPGEYIALVGPSGSGKSTIFRLLLGFETPTAGSIAYDGQDLIGLDVTAVRRRLGVVLQFGHINAGSIFQNVCAGGIFTLDDAWEAAEAAGLADDLREMPMGMHTVVSGGGTNLSGGQRQRLLIARALVGKPKILLLDEATSALDNKTQSIVSASLSRRKVTRIVIAHRLSTIRDADRIFVLDRGRIVESGTFGELLRQGGIFASMMARQIA